MSQAEALSYQASHMHEQLVAVAEHYGAPHLVLMAIHR